ncbi:MAG: hypothetical protein N2Z72_03745, partial [Bacteroidales bacterium]|nr:hypothetical protein [Bacteroidales bacterium]
MKNLFTSIGIFISLALLAQQSLSLSYAGGLLNPNDTIVVYGDSGLYTTIVIHIYVTNQTNQNLPVKVKKAEIQIVPGSENTFCWGQCYIPTVYVSPDAITIPAHTTDDHSFWGEYKPMGHLGVSTIRYTFFVSDNPSDSVAVYVKYIATPVGINEIAKNKPILYLNDTGQWLYISHETQMESLIF